MNKINIYLVDDHSLFREGLRFLLSKIEMVNNVYEAENGAVFLDGLAGKSVDLVLMDIEMPVIGGVEATIKALEADPSLKIIALSMYSEESYYYSMLEAGAVGFLLKNSSFKEVKTAISDVMAGRTYFSAEIIQALKNHISCKNPETGNSLITPREMDVLCGICKGWSNEEIAERLFISRRTVEKHRENLLQKTNSKNTASLIIFAFKNQIISF